jgi:hypothetical protein
VVLVGAVGATIAIGALAAFVLGTAAASSAAPEHSQVLPAVAPLSPRERYATRD